MNNTVKLDLTIEQLNIVLAGLAKLPIEVGMTTFSEVQTQAQAQLRSSSPEAPLASKLVE